MDTAPTRERDELELTRFLKETWDLFAAKPLEHVVVGAIVSFGSLLSLGILAGPLLVAYLRIIDRQRRGEPFVISQLFAFEGGLSAFLATLAIGVLFALGLFFFILPGVLVIIVFGYTYWFIAFDGLGAFEAMGESWRFFKDNFTKLLAVWLILLLAYAVGASTFVGGLFITPCATIFACVAFFDLRRP